MSILNKILPGPLERALSKSIAETFGELMADEKFTDNAGRAFRQASKARERVERNVGILLTSMNIPTREDIDKLTRRVSRLEDDLMRARLEIKRLNNGDGQPGTTGAQKAQRPSAKGKKKQKGE